MLRRRFLFAKVYEEKPVYKYTYTTTDGQMLSDLAGVQNHKYENGVGSFETYNKKCVSFEEQNTLESIVIPEGTTSIGNYAFCYCTNLTDITIPNSVTSIGENALYSCESLTNIEIPDSVTSIGYKAFDGCRGLTNVEIGNGVTRIEERAFEHCAGLTSITIPNKVVTIGQYAFYDCIGLTSVEFNAENCTTMGNGVYPAFGGCTALSTMTIGDDVKTIPNYAFYNCSSLTSIEIGNSVTSIGDDAFKGCNGLTSIIVATGNANYDSRDNCNAIIETATNTLIKGFKSTIIPDSVTRIGWSAFSDCSGLTSIVVPDGVTSIGSWAFCNCKDLTSIEIPSSVTSIDYQAFNSCSGLKEVHINDLVAWCNISFLSNPLQYSENLYLNGEKVTDLVIPDGVTEIQNYAFNGYSGLTSVTIPDSVTRIGNYAFDECTGLTNVIIGNSVTRIGDEAFNGCTSLTNVVIGHSVKDYGIRAFSDCTGIETVFNFSDIKLFAGSSNYGGITRYADKVYNVPNGSKEDDFIFGKPNDVNTLLYYLGNATEVILPADCKGDNYAIGASVFEGNTTIASVVIPNSVISIGDAAFQMCTGLTSIEIPNSVTSIGGVAFNGCNQITKISSLNPTPPVISSSTFGNVGTDGVLKVPKGSDYNSWMGTSEYYLGYYNWTIEEIETV